MRMPHHEEDIDKISQNRGFGRYMDLPEGDPRRRIAQTLYFIERKELAKQLLAEEFDLNPFSLDELKAHLAKGLPVKQLFEEHGMEEPLPLKVIAQTLEVEETELIDLDLERPVLEAGVKLIREANKRAQQDEPWLLIDGELSLKQLVAILQSEDPESLDWLISNDARIQNDPEILAWMEEYGSKKGSIIIGTRQGFLEKD